MAAKDDKLIIRAEDVRRGSRNAAHLHHRLNASGTGPHRNRKRYSRRVKHRRDYGAE